MLPLEGDVAAFYWLRHCLFLCLRYFFPWINVDIIWSAKSSYWGGVTPGDPSPERGSNPSVGEGVPAPGPPPSPADQRGAGGPPAPPVAPAFPICPAPPPTPRPPIPNTVRLWEWDFSERPPPRALRLCVRPLAASQKGRCYGPTIHPSPPHSLLTIVKTPRWSMEGGEPGSGERGQPTGPPRIKRPSPGMDL